MLLTNQASPHPLCWLIECLIRTITKWLLFPNVLLIGNGNMPAKSTDKSNMFTACKILNSKSSLSSMDHRYVHSWAMLTCPHHETFHYKWHGECMIVFVEQTHALPHVSQLHLLRHIFASQSRRVLHRHILPSPLNLSIICLSLYIKSITKKSTVPEKLVPLSTIIFSPLAVMVPKMLKWNRNGRCLKKEKMTLSVHTYVLHCF